MELAKEAVMEVHRRIEIGLRLVVAERAPKELAPTLREAQAAAEEALAGTPAGLTEEALARQVSQKVGRQMPPGQVANALRERPQRFVEGSDGRWRLRERAGIMLPEEAPAEADAVARQEQAARPALRRGCYVVFDLEATGQNPRVPETEIIQIAAQRWVDGQPQDAWATFARTASGTIPAQIVALTHISEADIHDAPDAAKALRQFFAYVGDLPLIAHNGASYVGPLVEASCERLGLPLPDQVLLSTGGFVRRDERWFEASDSETGARHLRAALAYTRLPLIAAEQEVGLENATQAPSLEAVASAIQTRLQEIARSLKTF